jgi:hypothetical protein
MGQSLNFQLVYGVYPTGDSESFFETNDGDPDFVQAIIEKRGLPYEINSDDFPERNYSRGVSLQARETEWREKYNAWKARPDIQAQQAAYDASKAAVAADYPNLEVVFGGVTSYFTVAVLAVKGTGFEASDAVTPVELHGLHAPGHERWKAELRRALAELEVDPEVVSVPGWVGVTSYG